MLILLLLLALGNKSLVVESISDNEINYLQDNFFANLRVDPRLEDNLLTKEKKDFIDEQVANFIGLTKRSQGVKKNGRQKRSFPIDQLETLSRDKYGVYILDSVKEKFALDSEFAKDIVFFVQNDEWFVATLESDVGDVYANKLRFYKNFGESFQMIHEVDVNKAVKLSLRTTVKGTFVGVAENRSEDDPKSKIFLFLPNTDMKVVQMLNVNYVNDILIWEQNDEMFLAVCQQMQIRSNQTIYDTTTFVYKWLGEHFDIIQQLSTYNAQEIVINQIGNANFLAIANNKNDRGETNIFSEIFKYDLDSQQFLTHQKIATKSAKGVRFFNFVVENFRETFLVVANYYDEESNEEAKSVLYKYVDDYFIPFQSLEIVGVTGWLPAAGPNGEFVLLASTASEGIKMFQYDGWRFIESKVQRNDGVFGPGVTSMNSIVYNKEVFIAIANQNNDGQQAEIYQFNFVHRNMLTEYHEKTLSWCRSALSSLQMDELQREIVGEPGRADSEEFSSGAFGEWQEFNNSNDEDLHFRLTTIESNLDTQNTILQNLNITLNQAIHPTITGDVFAKSVIINNALFVENLFTQKLNNESMDEFTADVLTTQGFHTEETLYFENLTVDNPLNPVTINGNPAKNLLHATDNLKLKRLNVDGKAIFEAPIRLRGSLNNITITNQTILLQEGDQYLQGQLSANEIFANDFETRQINKIDLRFLEYLSIKPLKLENIESLTVQRLTVAGLLNNVDIETLDKFALKIQGDQEITAKYSFNSLSLNNLQTNQKLADEFVKINAGEYWVANDVLFTNDIFAENPKIKYTLNHLKVNRYGRLDLLYKNSPQVQFIDGFKEIETVKLGDVQFRGKILSELLEKINPVIHIKKPIEVKGNYVFQQGVVVERLLQAKDIVSGVAPFSIERLRHEGLKLNDENVPIPMNLLQTIRADNVNASRINGRDAKAFVVTGTNEVQVITGVKVIQNDLYVTNFTKAVNINNIDMQQLEDTTVKLNGNQVLTGKFVFANLEASKINTNAAQLGEKLWSNVITTDQDQIITGRTTIFNNLKTNNFESHFCICVGNINNFNFSSIVNDTITTKNIMNIHSRKIFRNLTVDKLTVNENNELQHLSDFVELFDSVVLPSAQIENLTFSGTCNKLSNKNFNDAWYSQLNGDVNFENITVSGALQIDSDYINNLKIEDLVMKTVKRDESFHFDNAIFDRALASAKPILLKGQMEGVNLEKLSSDRYKDGHEKASVFNEINVKGKVFFGGLVSGFNTSELCSFAYGNNENRKLIIEGSARIENILKTKFVNTYDLEAIKNSAWLKNKPTQLSGYLTFDKIHFNDNVSCSGSVGGISLDYLARNYFSRTADQNVSASLEFADVVFQNGVEAPKANLTGNVNDLDLNEFLGTALLDGMEQVFEQTVYLDECIIKGDLQGEYLVNDMDLQTEVMRYDAENIVTGLKEVSNLKAKRLKINERTWVQNVPLHLWIKNAILKTGNFNVTGRKIFNGLVHFKKGIHVHGPFNGVFVDKNHTMLKSLPQTITGHKTFVQTGSGLVSFKSIDFGGRINGILLNELLENQVYKTGDSVIHSSVNFGGNVTAINVNFDKTYNGINVSDFVKKATHFAEFNNIEVVFQNLLNVAYSVEESIKRQAYYLSTYKIIKEFYYQTHSVVPVLFMDGVHRLAAVYTLNDTSAVVFYVWDSTSQTFAKTSEKIQYEITPFYTTALNYPDGDYFYIEGYNNIHNEYVAAIWQFANDSTFMHTDMQMEQSRSVSSFKLPYNNEKCVVAIFANAFPATVVCNVFSARPEGFTIDSVGATKAVTITIQNVLYIITINLYSQREESSMNLFKYDAGMRQFYLAQTVYVAQPNDVTVVSYKDAHYIAVSSGHVPNTMHTGSVEVYRHDPKTKNFIHHQNINIDAPIQVEFAILPSQELLLFTLTESSTQPLIIYEYSGISGFTEKIVASGIGKSVSMKQFTTGDQEHFLVLRLVSDVVLVLRAVFKGQQ